MNKAVVSLHNENRTVMENEIKVLYRYEKACFAEQIEGDYMGNDTNNVSVELYEYPVHSETPKGYWILWRGGKAKKWTSKTAKTRFAYPTKKQAIHNYIRRTKSSIGHYKHQIRYSELAIEKANIILESFKDELSFTP